MTHLERFVALLDDMRVYYELEENDGGTIVSVSGGSIPGFLNKGHEGAEITFDKQGNCEGFWA